MLAGVIGNYLYRKVAPLMARWLPLYKMTVDASPKGTRLSASPHYDGEIAWWLREAMEVRKGVDKTVILYVFPVPGCPQMHPKPGFIELMSLSDPFSSLVLCPLILILLLPSLPRPKSPWYSLPHPMLEGVGGPTLAAIVALGEPSSITNSGGL